MVKLPALLIDNSGKHVTTANEWETVRRAELLDAFSRYVFGQTPNFDFVRYSEVFERLCLENKAILRKIRVSYGKDSLEGAFHFYLLLPTGVELPPVMVLGVGRHQPGDESNPAEFSPYWPAKMIVERGFASAYFHFGELAADEDDGFSSGVFRVLPKERLPDSWGAIGAWAWGYSRIMDYLAACKDVDSHRVGVVGHSRGGKASLWAGAQDTRFALVCSNNSGCTGAALSRLSTGEKIHDINTVFPYWFCENYKQYNHNEDALPVDQHMLLALIAPRKLYVASATEDTWADPNAEFAGCTEALPAFALYGEPLFGVGGIPAADCPLWGDRIAYHLRTGRHFLTEYDWQQYMNFLEH